MGACLEKTFFVGLGAQKAGTTWVAQYLRAHPEVFIPKYKELHFFNANIGFGKEDSEHTRFLKKFQEITANHKLDPKKPQSLDYYERLEHLIDRLRLIGHPELYLDNFLKRVQPEHKVFGEITPSYALLDEGGFWKMRDTYRPIRALFLMRDPVSRIWSNLWFKNSKSPNYDPHARWPEALKDAGIMGRTRYDLAVQRMENVFAPEEIMFGFFETLFNEDFVRKLCSFLDITYRPADFSANPNPTKSTKKEKPKQFVSAVRQELSCVYDFTRARFGADCPW